MQIKNARKNTKSQNDAMERICYEIVHNAADNDNDDDDDDDALFSLEPAIQQ